MPYIVDKSDLSVPTADLSSPLSVAIPANHQANDLLLCFVQQDVGTGSISISGWTEIGTQATERGQRTAVFYKIASSSSESPASITVGLIEDVTVVMVVVRGANTTTPINGQARTNMQSTLPESPTLTTTSDNCLVFKFWGFDRSDSKMIPETLHGGLQFLVRVSGAANNVALGYVVKRSAGAVPTYKMRNSYASASGVTLTIAINDNGDGNVPPVLSSGYDILKHFSVWHTLWDGVTWAAPNTLAASSVAGRALGTVVLSTTLLGDTTMPYCNGWCVGSNEIVSNYAVGGVYSVSPAWDLSDVPLALRFANSLTSPSFNGFGAYIVLQDSSDNWAAYEITPTFEDVVGGIYYETVFSPSSDTPVDKSTTAPDLTDIVKVGYLFGRTTTSTIARYLCFRHFLRLDPLVFVAGSPAAPLNLASMYELACGWIDFDPLVVLQGTAQVLLKGSIQLGDGSTETYVDLSANAGELPLSYKASRARRFWKLKPGDAEIRIKASANDTMKVSNCVLATDTRQGFVIDAASSASADYDFSGLVLSGFDVVHDVSGIEMQGVSFVDCAISLDGGELHLCSISKTSAAVAVSTNDPSNISGCTFVSNGAGHAIEITATGTYTFDGNTFSGYGSAGTSDAAIYNNSGGAVTLNVTGGGDTPTVKNGSGASTTINNAVTITLQNVVSGSRYRVEKTSDGTLIGEGSAAGGDISISWSYPGSPTGVTIKVRQGTSAPKYEPYTTQATVTADGATVFVSQKRDLIAA